MAEDFDDPFEEERAFPRYQRGRSAPSERAPLPRVRLRLTAPLGAFGRETAAESAFVDGEPVVSPTSAPAETSWIEIQLLDEAGGPVAGAEYAIELPDGAPRTGTLGADGKARLEGIAPGACKVSFSRLPAGTS